MAYIDCYAIKRQSNKYSQLKWRVCLRLHRARARLASEAGRTESETLGSHARRVREFRGQSGAAGVVRHVLLRVYALHAHAVQLSHLCNRTLTYY